MMRAMQIWLVSIGVVLVAVMASAQTDAGNGVARVSLMRGDVTVQRGDSGELTEAAINAPLVTGDRLLTGPGSRAELQFDYAHFLRLAPNSEVRMLELRPERYLVAVAEGTVAFSRIDQFDSEVEVNTPSVSVRPVQRGNFRVSVFPDGTSEITVREGQVEVYTPAGVERLGPGRTMMARGDLNNPEFQYVQQARRDEFDNWNRDRDRLIRRSESYRYVDRSIPGAHELDAYGSWVNVAPYGMVWQPRVAVGWAPYRFGRWSWVDYYGWNWISYDPWGWAPFHYGRWFHSPGFGWCWYPGGFVRHYYSPAVVGWFGFGNVGVGFGFGNVGWVPLAPFEPFYPWWGGGWGGWHGGGWRNRTFIDNSVTIVNNTNITNVYRNARVNNGYTVVDGQSFARGASVRHNGAGVESLRTASAVRGQVPVTPDRGSLRFSDRAVDRGQYEARLSRTEGRQFHTRTEPARVDRASFETQRGAMEQVQRQAFSRGESAEGSMNRQSARGESATVGGDPGSRGATRGGVATQPAQDMGRGASPMTGSEAGTSRGVSARGQSADVPSRGDAGMVRGAGDASAAQERGGWRRFGEPVTRQGTDRGVTATRGDAAGANRTGSVDSGRGATRGTTTPDTDSGSSWRRFGEPAGRTSGESGRGVESPARGTSPSDGSSRGTGAVRGTEPARGSESTRGSEVNRATPATRGDSSADRGGWQSFGRGSGSGSAAERGSATRGSAESRAPSSVPAPTTQRSTTRGDSASGRSGYEGGTARGGAQQQLNVSPPIVRERGGSTAAPSSGGRGSGSSPGATSTGRGTTNRSSVDSSGPGSAYSSGWRRFDGGAASSGVQVYGSSRSSASPNTYSSPAAGRGSSGTSNPGSWRSFSGSGNQSTSRGGNDAYAGSSRGSAGSGYSRSTAPSSSGSYSRSGGTYSSPSGRSSSGSSYGTYRSPAPSYGGSSASRSGGSYSRPSGSYGGSIGGGSRSSGSYGGSVSRGGGSMGGGMRSSGGGASVGGRSSGGMSSGGSRGGGMSGGGGRGGGRN